MFKIDRNSGGGGGVEEMILPLGEGSSRRGLEGDA
jgi:hypothetical protein